MLRERTWTDAGKVIDIRIACWGMGFLYREWEIMSEEELGGMPWENDDLDTESLVVMRGSDSEGEDGELGVTWITTRFGKGSHGKHDETGFTGGTYDGIYCGITTRRRKGSHGKHGETGFTDGIYDGIYCETCEFWLNGRDQLSDHKKGHKHSRYSRLAQWERRYLKQKERLIRNDSFAWESP